jgi:hypothetical protein
VGLTIWGRSSGGRQGEKEREAGREGLGERGRGKGRREGLGGGGEGGREAGSERGELTSRCDWPQVVLTAEHTAPWSAGTNLQLSSCPQVHNAELQVRAA